MSRQAVLIGLLAAFIALGSCGDQIPTIPTRAGKVHTDDCHVIVWPCEEQDNPLFTIFHGNMRFFVNGTSVEFTEYLSDDSKMVYPMYETESFGNRHRATFGFTETQCGLWTSAIEDTSLVTRIYEGEVDWNYRGDPQHSQYYVREDEENYKIAKVYEDSTLGYTDFWSFYGRLNKPPSIGGYQHYLPTNLDTMAWGDADKGDDREFLRSPFGFADWISPCPPSVSVVSSRGNSGGGGGSSGDAGNSGGSGGGSVAEEEEEEVVEDEEDEEVEESDRVTAAKAIVEEAKAAGTCTNDPPPECNPYTNPNPRKPRCDIIEGGIGGIWTCISWTAPARNHIHAHVDKYGCEDEDDFDEIKGEAKHWRVADCNWQSGNWHPHSDHEPHLSSSWNHYHIDHGHDSYVD